MPRKPLILLALLSLIASFRTHLVQMQWVQGRWSAVSAQSAMPVASNYETDLDGDGQIERIDLTGGRMSVSRGEESLWSSPPEWNIIGAQTSDLNGDDHPEVALLVWRPFKPWPIDAWLPHGGRIRDFADAAGQSCHIILWGWDGDEYRELWAGSAMAEPVLGFLAADWNGDGRQELATVESSYDYPARAKALALWKWNGFGFSLLGRQTAEIGQFVFLTDASGGPSMLLDSAGDWFFGR